MKRFAVIAVLGILLLPLIANVKLADAVVGGPYTDRISAELGSSNRSSGNGFNPDEIIISVGTTVTWTNKDTVGHTIVSGSQGDADAGQLFDTGPRWNPGAKFEHTFDTVGEFSYFCTLYPWMTGKVMVAEVVIQEDGVEDLPIDIPEDDIPEEDVADRDGKTVRDFIVEDPDGDQMFIRVSRGNLEAFDALTEMSMIGEEKWVGGEIQTAKNDFGFKFKPDTVVVSEITAEGLQAVKYKSIQEDIDYWTGLGTVYISGKVVSIRDKITVNYQESDYNVTATMTGGAVKGIEIQPDSTSLLVKLETGATKTGNLTITLPRELIDSRGNGDDKEFVVKVGNDDADYKELKKTSETERKLRIELPPGTNQVEIIGTQVVPEFPLGLAAILAGLISVIVVMTRPNLRTMLK